MTDPIVRLETAQLSIEPGGQGRTLVTVRNLGTIVEGFRLQILGEGVSEWAQVTPPEVQVYPEQEATAVVVFSPPAGNLTRSGTFPFAVRAESVVDGDTSAIAEGDLEIGQVFGLQSKITPVTSSGRWRGKHFLEITNWGNAPIRLKLAAMDPDGRLAFLIGPETLDLPLGVTGHAQLRVRTLKPFLRGAATRLPFQVLAEPDPPDAVTGPPSLIGNPRRATLDGAFVQRAIVSKVTVVLAAVAVAAIAGLAAFVLTRGPGAEPGGLDQGPPQTPVLTAASNNATSVQLLWKSQPNIDSYKLTQLTANGDVSGVSPIDGAQNVTEVKDLQPSTAYCFQLAAVRGGQTSQLSDKACVTTGAAPPAAATTPAATAGSESTAASPAGSSVTEPTVASDAVTSGQSTAVVPPPPSGQITQPQASSAASSPAESATGAPATAVFTPNQFIDVVFTYPANDAQALARAQALAQQYAAQGIPASVLRSTDFPKLELIKGRTPVDSYLVYIGPFASEAEAKSKCPAKPAVGAICQLVQPSPGG